jgi:hypothetical protein
MNLSRRLDTQRAVQTKEKEKKMKKIVALVAFAALTAGAATVFAGGLPQQGVSGSSHDIIAKAATGGYYKDDYGRVCIYCHTPHNAAVNLLDPQPLWNRTDPTSPTPYSWVAPANIAAGLASDPLAGPSRLCLSCHDGVSSVDAHGPASGTARGSQSATGTPIATSTGRAWTDLSGTHPIGFNFNDAYTARGSNELVDPATAYYLSDIGNPSTWDTVNRGTAVYSTKKISDTLYNNGIMTCASCHDVHNTRNARNNATLGAGTYTLNNGATEPNYFVWAPEQGSMLCLSCHIK